MEIGGFDLDQRCLIIAELSANHGGSLETALKTIRAAKSAGADAIKLQTFTPDTITLNSNKPYFQIKNDTLWDGRNLYDLYKEAHTPWEWHETLFREARDQGLICFSSPFDKSAVDFLEQFDPPAYKIASFEIQDIPLIEYVASKKRPVIISTGIAEYADIQLAIKACRAKGNEELILLKCTSSYPAPIELANLRTMVDMKSEFGTEIGLSDHTKGEIVPITSVALGAKVIEKHFILDKSIGGPDVEFSLDRNEFERMVMSVRQAEKSLGHVSYELSEKVRKNRQFSRSLFAAKDIAEGDVFTEENVRSVRPGFGLHPKFLPLLLGQQSKMSFEKGEPISEDLLVLMNIDDESS